MNSASVNVKPVLLGYPLPPDTPHPIAVSLLTWDDVRGLKHNDKRIIDAMLNVYPRLSDHISIRKLMSIVQEKYGSKEEKCRLFPTRRIAEHCLSYLHAGSVKARALSIVIRQDSGLSLLENVEDRQSNDSKSTIVHVVFHHADGAPLASQFWQFTGTGISSRHAEYYLSMLGEDIPDHLSSKPCLETLLAAGSSAKKILRQRIASALSREGPVDSASKAQAGIVSEDDVYLFSTGMATIWNSHQLALGIRPDAKSVCFGFPYLDTHEVLKHWGPGCHFFGFGTAADMDELENILEQDIKSRQDPTAPPTFALFTEFTSNPLLYSPDLLRLRSLADKYNFLVVIDDTIGTFANVHVLPYADVLVSSLTKIFSGAANVMGGSLVLNSSGRHYGLLKTHLTSVFEDTYHESDAIQLEYNSREYRHRVEVVNRNTEAVCDFFHAHSIAGGASESDAVIKRVFYPKYHARENYERYRISSKSGYGGLFSLTFSSVEASRAFYDALSCWKGPSFGANLTLACPYAVLAHYPNETEWAAGYGVEETLLRISPGLEDTEALLKMMTVALDAAKAAVS